MCKLHICTNNCIEGNKKKTFESALKLAYLKVFEKLAKIVPWYNLKLKDNSYDWKKKERSWGITKTSIDIKFSDILMVLLTRNLLLCV